MKLYDRWKNALSSYRKWKEENIFSIELHEVIKYASNFFRMIGKDNPLILYSIIIGGITTGILPFISLYFSSHILDALLAADMERAKVFISMLLIGRLMVGCVNSICAHVVKILAKSGANSIRKQTTNKAFTIDYEKYELTETMDKIRRTKNFDGNCCLEEQIETSYQTMGRVSTVIFSLFFNVQLIFKLCQESSFVLYSVLLGLFLLLVSKGMVMLVGMYGKAFVETVPGEARYQSAIKAVWYSALDVQNGKDIRLYKMQKIIQRWHTYWVENWNKIWGKCIKKVSLCNAGITVLFQILEAAAFIYMGFGAFKGIISIGEVILYSGTITTMLSSVNATVSAYNMLGARFKLLSDFGEFIESSELDYDGNLTVKKSNDDTYEVEFRNVSFKYPDTENYALKNINLKLKVNKRLAIVGQNGSGKTTLVKLLCRLYKPTEGEILLNGINISEYDYEDYSNLFAVVFQDFQLFALPLDENIAGTTHVDEERCLNVLEDVGLKETVTSWPNKQHMPLYKNLGDGINVSGGEAQKIAIARALYKDSPIVIMDEPTAALDPIAEAEIYGNFNELIHEKTAIFISHRMSSCKFCDEIVVLEGGELIQKGSHQELVKVEGMYQQLWNAQAQYYK